jgi:hypothetical protein
MTPSTVIRVLLILSTLTLAPACIDDAPVPDPPLAAPGPNMVSTRWYPVVPPRADLQCWRAGYSNAMVCAPLDPTGAPHP